MKAGRKLFLKNVLTFIIGVFGGGRSGNSTRPVNDNSMSVEKGAEKIVVG